VQQSFDNKLTSSLETNWEMCTTVQEKWDLLVSSVQAAAMEAIPVSIKKSAGSWKMRPWYVKQASKISSFV